MRKLLVVLVCILALFCWQQSGPTQPQWHPLIRVLLEVPVDNELRWRSKKLRSPRLAEFSQWLREHGWPDEFLYRTEDGSPFFQALKKLARRQGLDPRDYAEYDSGEPVLVGRFSAPFHAGRAVEVDADGERYVVAILEALGGTIPGVAADQLVLLDLRGRLRDQLRCGVKDSYQAPFTEVKPTPDSDGAWFVIHLRSRLTEGTTPPKWHTITYGGHAYTFARGGRAEQSLWVTKGLCRIGVQKGKFVVLFPKLEKSDAELLRGGGP